MKHKFGWDLPPGVTNRMIEEQAGAFEEEEMKSNRELLAHIVRITRQERDRYRAFGRYCQNFARGEYNARADALHDISYDILTAIRNERQKNLDMWIGEDIEEEIKRQFPNG